MKQILLCSFLLLSLATVAVADRPAPDRQYTIRSANGQYEFTMYPAGSQDDSGSAPYGEAHSIATSDPELAADADRTPLWKVSGWYAAKTFLSNDGRNLVRMGPWASKPLDEELAVAFYCDGREIRRYVVADLVQDESAVQRSVSHYNWQASDSDLPRLTEDGRFQLRTIDGRLVTFDITNGEKETDVFPIDHRPDIGSDKAITKWLSAMRSLLVFGPGYAPQSENGNLLHYESGVRTDGIR